MDANITTLLDKAKHAIAAGESSLRKAAELIAQAQDAGATQRQIAKRVGKSQPWVNQLLAWRRAAYRGGAFERSHKARVISRANQQKRIPAHTTPEMANAIRAKAEFQTERARAIAAMFTETKHIPRTARAELIAALNMLATSHDTAAVLVERCRKRLNLDWPDLLVPADENQGPVRVQAAA